MMRKLNNKGMTAAEILVCFILVGIITVSVYTMVSSYKNKQQIESYKEKVITYKNLLTKEINDDLIKNGLLSSEIVDLLPGEANKTEKKVILNLGNGDKKCLNIKSHKAYDYLWGKNGEDVLDDDILPADKDVDDDFLISYGFCGSETEYPIPNFGMSVNPNGKTIYDLRINNIYISNENSVLSIYIGFYHPELGTRYAMDIVCPIDF